ncbi:MAG: flagellar filament capping protein FliD [Phycisphaerae bacterium]
MGTISSGTGLISGLNITDIVTKLMAIEQQPITLLQRQVSKLSTEKTAYQTISAQLLALKLAVTPFKSGVTFRPNTAKSSDENILTAQASSAAVPGQYTFNVRQLAQSHQMVSQGFNDTDQSPIGTGTISLELGQGNLDRDVELNVLRNQQGIRQGQIRITDRAGVSADVDLSTAVTVSDVLQKINSAGIGVQAKVSGDHFVLEDTTGSALHNLVVQDINGGFFASDLGITGNTAANSITGSNVVTLSDNSPLAFLNDGNGIRTNGFGDDLQFALQDGTSFNANLSGMMLDSSLSILNNGQGIRAGSIKITNKTGTSATIDLSTAKTVNDVVGAINNSGLNLTATLVSGSKLMIADGSGGTNNLVIENVGATFTATDLGLVGSSTTTSLVGKEIYRVTTLGDVKRAIEDAAHRASNPDKLAVSISSDGKNLILTDTTGGSGNLVISSLSGSHAAEDLGIVGTYSTASVTGKRLVAGLNTVLLRSLNGGSGVAAGIIAIQNRSGQSTQVDLRNAQSLQDVLDTINNTSGIGIQASLNETRTGIVIKDLTGSTTANLKISDVDSTTANDLHIAIDSAANQVDAGNNHLQYISENTLLSQLNGGTGVAAGSFSITDSAGNKATVVLSSANLSTKTVGDLLDLIKGQGVGISAAINATGDGIAITDTAGGAGTLTIGNVGSSTTASNLNIAKMADTPGAATIDGSFEYKISIGGSDTLQALADKINALKGPFSAAIINDGSDVNSYHLSLTSKVGGKAGKIILNGGGTNLNMYDLTEPKDAIISLGNSSGGNSLVVTSNKNTFIGLVPGLTITANNASASPVTVTVSQDVESVKSKVQAFVDKFNAVIETISTQTKYDSETQQAGPLLGDYQVQSISDKLYNLINNNLTDVGGIRRLSQVGVSIGSDGKLQLDDQKFQDAYTANPTAVENFFSTQDKGLGFLIDKMTDDFTRSSDGLIARTTGTYDDRTKLLNDRITFLQDLLKSKETRLYTSFNNMETALAKLQGMQSALSSLSSITSTTTSSSSSSS